MKRWLRRIAVAFFLFWGTLIFSCTVMVIAEEAALPTQQKDTKSKAKTIKSESFLAVPDGLKSDGKFTVAKTPPVVDICFFEGLEDHGKGTLWSSWGDGCFASNGKYYTSVGDHLGIDANSYVYEYDPVTKVMRRVVDVLQAIMHALGFYGHGKIHSGIHEAADGKLYFSTYWGKHREIHKAFERGKYKGSIVMSYDPKTGKTENFGAVAPFKGLPASNFDPKHQLVYFHAVHKAEPKASYTGNLAVFDVRKEKLRFLGGADRIDGNRTILVTKNGRAYFSAKDGNLHYYDPETNKLHATKAELPSGKNSRKSDMLRAAATGSDKNGLYYGMTASGQLFSFDPTKEKIKDLGPNFIDGFYNAAMVMDPNKKYLYYAPGSHGGGARASVPVVQYDIATGKRKVLAFLADTILNKLKYKVGGTYNLQIDPAGERLFFTFNGADVDGRGVFGKTSVIVVHLPKSER